MRTYYIAQELYTVLCGDLNGKEIQKRGGICVHIADSLCCTVETNRTLYSNYTPIKIKKNIYWSIVSLQYCVSLYCTAK